MDSVKVPEKLDERNASKAFPRIQIGSVEEASSVKRDAAMHLASLLHNYSLRLQKLEVGLDSPLKEEELKGMEKSIKSDTAKIGDAKLERYTAMFIADAKKGANPFRSDYISSMEFLMRNEYGYSSFTNSEGKSGIAEVTEKRSAERSGHKFTVLDTEIIGIARPPSHFFTLKQGFRERNFIEITSDPAEMKQTIELLHHLQDVAHGKEPDVGMIFGHNAFLGGSSCIIPEEQYQKLDNAEYRGFVKKWMEVTFKEKYRIEDVLVFSEDAEDILGIKDPQLWMRVQMLRHMKAGVDELSVGISPEGLDKRIQRAFRELSENHEMPHAISNIEKRNMPEWLDELTAMLSSIHGYSPDYRGSPQFALSIIVPLFSLAVEKLEKVTDLRELDYGERAALSLVYGLAELDAGKTPDLNRLSKQLLKFGLNPEDALERLARMESFVLKQRAMKLEELAYSQLIS